MCTNILVMVGLTLNMVGVVVLLIPQIFVKDRELFPGTDPVTRFRKEERPTTILGLIIMFVGFLFQFIAYL